ncbi:MAG: hypothetical protein KGR26_13230, partial [Cyanobacteria bacterium REEB65]|nr:hypothetical protein [Cyanobacteria bacterium REEB65]
MSDNERPVSRPGKPRGGKRRRSTLFPALALATLPWIVSCNASQLASIFKIPGASSSTTPLATPTPSDANKLTTLLAGTPIDDQIESIARTQASLFLVPGGGFHDVYD